MDRVAMPFNKWQKVAKRVLTCSNHNNIHCIEPAGAGPIVELLESSGSAIYRDAEESLLLIRYSKRRKYGEETLKLSGGDRRKRQTNNGRVICGLALHITNIHCFGPCGADHNELLDISRASAKMRLPKEG